ncbi:MAG: ribonuclease R [Deltaproteobacteria bacterium]|nr:ribonuclease R [Deltaproteobacteria bacterium]
MKDQILSLLRADPKHQFNARQIARRLDLTSGDHKELRAALKELAREGKIIIHPVNLYSFRDVKKILKGTLSIHAAGYGFFIPDSAKKIDVFIPARYINYAMNGDVVLVESTVNRNDGRYEGRVIQILHRANSTFVGKLFKSGGQYVVRPIDATGLIEAYIPQKNLLKAVEGDIVLVRIIQYPGHGIISLGEIEKVFGKESNDKDITDAILQKHGIKKGFEKKVHDEIANIPDDVLLSPGDNRVDLRGLPIITIDGVTARDFDDAVCVIKKANAYVLYVCIADVSEYVAAGGALDQEAYQRGTSTYLTDECIPMLPERLSNHLCSLNPFKPRYTVTAEIHYNGSFEFTKALFYRSLIQSRRRATYQEVQAYFDGTGDPRFDRDVKKSLDNMRVLATSLIKQAAGRGALDFELSESEVIYDPQGKITAIQRVQRLFSHRLIEVFMIAANQAVAQLFTVKRLPLLYRVHDKPDGFKLANFVALLESMGLKRVKGTRDADLFKLITDHPMESYLKIVFLRSLKQARYSPENRGHYGLALSDYAHFTSPIRRYPDLVVHRQLKSILNTAKNGMLVLKPSDFKSEGGNKRTSTQYHFSGLQKIGERSSLRERESCDAESEVLKIRKARFIKDFIHEKFFGLITKITKYGLHIELEPHFVEGVLKIGDLDDDYYFFDERRILLTGRRSRRRLKIGDRLWVGVAGVDIIKGEVFLEPVIAKKKLSEAQSLIKSKRGGRRRR